MTFEEFQGTRRHVPDVAAATGIDFGEVRSGYMYDSDLHILDGKNGEFELYIFHDLHVSGELTELERILFGFASDERIWGP